ncbi:phosphate ABC transporter permease subunit PstC [Spelaeicoccus albus]|uniref:phosphate ABC transporter permease subunit PstC n=1 Tax=Spelaeicoccus albus TaxID=1280376 RepID=UPI001F01714F|nr:phosphate ABC transporter permease subunit PstC [Spelaeicoccus albus]
MQRRTTRGLGDRVFCRVTLGAGLLIVAALVGVAVFLVWQAYPAFIADPAEVKGGAGFWAYVVPLVAGTVIAAAIALVIATPVSVGIALFISHFAPRRMASFLGYLVDLLAAVPSVVYGLWGWLWLSGHIRPLFEILSHYLGWLPFFAGPASATGRTMLTAGIVLAVMILPIITSLSREVFLQAPRLNEEAALALGATRWEMVRLVVLPFGRSGVISAAMLGLGRALGETMAIAMVLSPGVLTASLVKSGNQTIAAEIAQNFPEAAGLGLSTLIAAGLVLFAITLIVNVAARAIIARQPMRVR